MKFLKRSFTILLAGLISSPAYPQVITGKSARDLRVNVNYIKDGDAEIYSTSSVPSNMVVSGGTLAVSSSSPINGKNSFTFASTTSGQKVTISFANLPAKMKNKSCDVNFSFVAPTALFKAYVTINSVTVREYQLTTGSDSQDLPLQALSFPCGDLTNQPKLVIESTGSSAGTLKFDDLVGGANLNIGTGPATIPRTTFTPTITTGSGAISNYTSTGQYYVISDTLYVEGQIVFSNTSSTFTGILVEIPSGFTLALPDTTAGRYIAGQSKALDTAVAGYSQGPVWYESGNKFQLGYSSIAVHTGSVPTLMSIYTNALPITFNSTDSINYSFKVPIVPIVQTVVSTQQAEFAETDCPTITGSWTTNTTYTCKWSRRKNRAYFDITVATSGAPTAANLTLNLPITIDTGKTAGGTNGNATNYLKSGSIYDNGTALFTNLNVQYNSATSVIVGVGASSGSYVNNNFVSNTIPMTFASGDLINVQFDVPVSGWIENPFPLIPQSVISQDNANGVTTINTVVSKTADYTATVNEDKIIMDSSGAARTLSLPAAAGVKGKEYLVINASNSNSTTIDPNGSETICGQTTVKLVGAKDKMRIFSDGTNWQSDDCVRFARMTFGGTTTYGNTSASNCTAATCTIWEQSGIFTAPSRGAGGVYTTSLTAGAYSAIPSCTCSSINAGTNATTCSPAAAPTLTAASFATYSPVGAGLQDSFVEVICTGPR